MISVYGNITASRFQYQNTVEDQADSLLGRKSGSGYQSGASAPQYVQIEFPVAFNVTRVCLHVDQYPNCTTVHYLYSGFYGQNLKLVKNITGFTIHNQWINLTFNENLTHVKYLKLETVQSRSWVAWRRFLVYGN